MVLVHPWRESKAGAVTLGLEHDPLRLVLVRLPEGAEASAGEEVADAALIGPFTLHRSPDERVPEVARECASAIVEAWPRWLESRILELMNGIGGLGRARSVGSHRAAMRRMDKGGPVEPDHPLQPLGIWGPYVEAVTREVRKGRFRTWEEARERLDPALIASIEGAIPAVLHDDMLGLSMPRMLLREPL